MLLAGSGHCCAACPAAAARDMPVFNPQLERRECPGTADIAGRKMGKQPPRRSSYRASAGADLHGRRPPRSMVARRR